MVDHRLLNIKKDDVNMPLAMEYFIVIQLRSTMDYGVIPWLTIILQSTMFCKMMVT